MYFLTIRPQKKQQEEMKKMRDNLKVGDRVVTIGGIRGIVVNVTDDSFVIETSDENTRIEFLEQALSYVVKPLEGHESDQDQGQSPDGFQYEPLEDETTEE